MPAAGRAASRAARNFQENDVTGDRRTSGTTASLAGLEQARERNDPDEIELALRRILLGHALIYGYDGCRSCGWATRSACPTTTGTWPIPALADDNRWMHRPPMDWAAAERRLLPETVEERLFAALRRARRHPCFHAAAPCRGAAGGGRRRATGASSPSSAATRGTGRCWRCTTSRAEAQPVVDNGRLRRMVRQRSVRTASATSRSRWAVRSARSPATGDWLTAGG